MKRIQFTFCAFIICALQGFSQTETIDSIEIKPEQIQVEHTFLKKLNCQSIQAKLLYNDPSMYSFILGNLIEKKFQTIEIDNQTGSILYFVFDKEPKNARGFIEGLLWGGDKRSKEHPEEIITKGNSLIILSFPYKSKSFSFLYKHFK